VQLKSMIRSLAVVAAVALVLVVPAVPADASLGSALVTLSGRLASAVQGTVRLANVPALTPVRALIALRQHDPAGLQQLIEAVADPRSRQYGHYLTPAQFDARFAPTAAAVQQVSSWARSAGLTVASVPVNNAYVYVTGTALAMGSALHTVLSDFSRDGRTFMAPA
jgi:kumamolisin